jgi:hypothetical protein
MRKWTRNTKNGFKLWLIDHKADSAHVSKHNNNMESSKVGKNGAQDSASRTFGRVVVLILRWESVGAELSFRIAERHRSYSRLQLDRGDIPPQMLVLKVPGRHFAIGGCVVCTPGANRPETVRF